MDSVTQATLGAAVGELLLGRKLGWRGAAWGAFFGTLPDLDILAGPWLSEMESLRWHRGISHSVLITFLAPLLLGPPLARLWRKRGVKTSSAVSFVFWVWSTHVLIDVFTSYGTQIWEPFSSARVATSNIFIIDLFFLLPLLVGTIVCLFLKRGSSRRRRWIRGALTMSTLYVTASFFMKIWAQSEMKEGLAQRAPGARLFTASPTFSNILLWRGLARDGEEFLIFYWSPMDGEPMRDIDRVPRNAELIEPLRGHGDVETLVWFSRDWWAASRTEPEQENAAPGSGEAADSRGGDTQIVFSDLRFPEIRVTTPEGTELRSIFRWRLSSNGEKVKAARIPRGGGEKEAGVSFADQIARTWRRLWGDQDALGE